MSFKDVDEYEGRIGCIFAPEAGRPVTGEELNDFGQKFGVWVGSRKPFERLDPVLYNERDLWKVGQAHLHRPPRFSLYTYVRYKLNWSFGQLQRVTKIPVGVLKARERKRVMYHPSELVALKRLSGLSWDDIGILLEAMG
jgi:hypothetical protein